MLLLYIKYHTYESYNMNHMIHTSSFAKMIHQMTHHLKLVVVTNLVNRNLSNFNFFFFFCRASHLYIKIYFYLNLFFAVSYTQLVTKKKEEKWTSRQIRCF